ncbi:MAG: hypothetical protein WBD20_09625 [Pirellulaceae bacterium]
MPTSTLKYLPEAQRSNRIGYIHQQATWAAAWKSWHPEHPVPAVDFETEIVVWVRNTRYLNRIQLGGVRVEDATAIIAAQETRSAKPIVSELHCVMFVLPRKGIDCLSDGKVSVELVTKTE